MTEFKFYGDKRYQLERVFNVKEEAKAYARKVKRVCPYKSSQTFARIETRSVGGKPTYLVWVRYYISGR